MVNRRVRDRAYLESIFISLVISKIQSNHIVCVFETCKLERRVTKKLYCSSIILDFKRNENCYQTLRSGSSPRDLRRKSTALPLSHAMDGRTSKTCRRHKRCLSGKSQSVYQTQILKFITAYTNNTKGKVPTFLPCVKLKVG